MKNSFPYLVIAAMLLPGCASSPDPKYYTLSPTAGAAHEDGKVTIKVRRPGLTATLDRPEMVSQTGDFRVQENQARLWSEPLDTMIERVLAQDLNTRLPGSSVVTQSGGIPTNATYVVDTEIQQFGTDGDKRAILVAQVLIHSPRSTKAMPKSITLHGAEIQSADSMAKALSDLIGQLADTIAASIAQ